MSLADFLFWGYVVPGSALMWGLCFVVAFNLAQLIKGFIK